MFMRPSVVFAVIWITWLISWIAAAFWSAPAEKRVTNEKIWVSRAALVAGAILLSHVLRRSLAETRLWHVGYDGGYALAALAALGILFAWWARIHLGRLWSSAVTRKAEHSLIDTGPYAFVRHPIYTGLIAAILATAVAQGTAAGLLGAALIAFGLWLKARVEERFLSEELGAGTYDAYRRRVPMLIPFARP
jgi:protein-S-isoprenylcysteine O-methyltransferase Ste14